MMTFKPIVHIAGILAVVVPAVLSSDEGGNSCYRDVSRIPYMTLANGVGLPQLLLGTAHLILDGSIDGSNSTDFSGFVPERTYRSLELGFENGWRGIDTAVMYRSHRQIGVVLGRWFSDGRLERSDVFLATKVFHGPVDVAIGDTYMNLDEMSTEDVTEATVRQLEQAYIDVGVGYFDLVLMHWPATMWSQSEGNRKRRIAAWRVLESFYQKGFARAIGVSNWNEHHLQQLEEDGAAVSPMVNQIESSVYLQYDNLVKYCKAKSIALQAYSPLGRTGHSILKDPVLAELAQKYGKNEGQIAMRYLIQKGFSVVNLSSSEMRLQSNPEIFAFELEASDMAKLDALNRPDGSWGLPTPYDMS